MEALCQGFLALIIAASVFGLFVAAIRDKPEPAKNEAAGAPEGAHHLNFKLPDASGSKLSVRAISKSSPSGEG